LFDCQDFGDCSLPKIAYLCPESQCAKNQRTGPCGGTREGKCGVADIRARAYERLKPYGEENTIVDGPVVFNNKLQGSTNAWANIPLGRDHMGRPATGQETAQ